MTDNGVRLPEERDWAVEAVDLRIQGHQYVHVATQLGYDDDEEPWSNIGP
jgi:hypothetical protein